jgi:UDP-N-acetylmuramoyl-tripeptide--D-alanyl-D-alanine ligase
MYLAVFMEDLILTKITENKMPQSTIWTAFLQQKAVSTDTRKIQPGDLFFALRGDNFNGNLFAAQALAAGAAFAIIDDPAFAVAGDHRYIVVPDTLVALQQLGRQFRAQHDIPYIGITGSNGKTTTKELVHAVLSSERRAYATAGNLNNHIGVPLTLLAMPADTEIAIIEMGANKPRDIEELVNIALPTHGIITNVGHAHLEGMGGIEGVQRTKGEMFDFIRAHNGFAFVNENDARVAQEAHGIALQVGYGSPTSAYHIRHIDESHDGQRITIQARGQVLEVQTQLLGRHNAENALLAVAVGQHFGISDAGIQRALAGYVPKMNRSQLHREGDRTFLLDAYNANPSSMEATIRSIAQQKHQSVALILGDMFELGPTADALHAGIWHLARTAMPEALIIGIGPIFDRQRPLGDARTQSYSSVQNAVSHIHEDVAGCNFILLKGSRGMALERLLPSLGVHL